VRFGLLLLSEGAHEEAATAPPKWNPSNEDRTTEQEPRTELHTQTQE
jgi:hypothetical protein